MRTWAKRLLKGIGAVLLLILLVLVGAVLFLQTQAGSGWVARQVLPRVNQNLSGALELGELDLRGDVLVLKDVVLRDPEGEVVAQAEEVRIDLGLTALVRRTARIDSVKVKRPQLFVVQDEAGTNLQRALAPRVPGPEQPKQRKNLPVDVAVDAFALEDGLVSYENVASAEPMQVVVDGLHAQGAFTMLRDQEHLNAHLDATGSLAEPRQGPVRLQAKLEGTPDGKSVALNLEVAGAQAVARAELTGERSEDAHVVVERLELPPGLARAFVSSWPLQVELVAKAEATKQGGALDATVDVSAGKGALSAVASANLDQRRVDRLKVEARNLDLSELSPGAPPSDLAFTLEGHGGGRTLETAEGEVHLRAPKSALKGGSFGPIRADLTARDGVATLTELSASLPGLSLVARGHASRERLALTGRAAATDLGEFARTLGRLAGPQGLPLSGKGALAFHVEGPPRAFAVEANGAFAQLRYGANDLRGLRLRVSVPNVRAPLAKDAEVTVRAERAVLSGKRWVRPHLSFVLQDHELSLRAGTRGFARVDLRARGRVARAGRSVWLSALRLRYPEATWRLERPARVTLKEQGVEVDHFRLRSGKQRLALDGLLTSDRVRATVAVRALDLRRLPRAFVDPSLALGGWVSAEVKASGRTKDPAVDARLGLVDVRFGQYRDIDASLDGRWRHGRAEGALAADALGIRAKGTFDLPVQALRTGGGGRVRAHVEVERMDVAQVFHALGKPPPFAATAQAELALSGTARSPRLDATVRLDDLQYRQLPKMDVALALATDERGRVGAKLRAQAYGEPSTLELSLPWTLGQLLRAPPSARQALRAPIALVAHLRDLPVTVPVAAPGAPPVARQPGPRPGSAAGGAGPAPGTPPVAALSGDLKLAGSLLRPVGGGELKLTRPRVGDFPGLAAALGLQLGPAENEVRLKVAQDRDQLLDARVTLHGALSRLMRPRAWTRLPFDAEATWGPVAIMDLQQWVPAPKLPDEEPAPLLTGVTTGQLRAGGTLGAPRLELAGSVNGLGSAQTASALGDVAVELRYADAQSVFHANLLSGAGGMMVVHLEAPLDLSYPSLQRGLRWRRTPVSASLRATAFDPAFLSGVSPRLRRVGGRLDASVEAKGTLSLPNVRGRFEWTDGLLALEGNGTYDAIHVLAEGTEERVLVRDITAHAAGGKAHLEAALTREGETVKFDAKGNLDDFPIIAQDQLVATVSLDTSARGSASMTRIEVPKLEIGEAHVKLPSEARKDIQQLEPPENVTFVWNGQPLEEAEKQAQRGTGGAGRAGAAPRELEVVIDAPRNLWVTGEDLNVEVGLEPGFRVLVVNEPQLFGTVDVLRGSVTVLGRRFEVGEPSQVVFAGPPRDPRLNLVAVHRNDREDVEVKLTLTGHGEDVRITPSSDPPLTETEIYTLIATGHRELRRGSTSASSGNPAASLLGSLVAARLRKTLQAALPLDVLNIQAGEKGVLGTRVEAGTYVTDRLYLGIETQIAGQRETGENQNQISVEYDVWRHWMLELEYGDARVGSADLIRRRRY